MMKKTYSVIILLTLVILIPLSTASGAVSEIPSWIKNTAGWWANDQVDDATFLDGIKFLIENNIIEITSESKQIEESKVKEKTSRVLNIDLAGKSTVSKGKIHFMKVIVTNHALRISGASVDVNITSPSGDLIKTVNGKTNSSGEFSLSLSIGGDFDDGTFKINVKADRKGFSPVVETYSFRVM